MICGICGRGPTISPISVRRAITFVESMVRYFTSYESFIRAELVDYGSD